MLLLFSHVGNVHGRPVVYKRRGAPRSPPAGEFMCRSLDWYPFDHSAPDLCTWIRCLGLHHESAPPGDIEMDKLLCNQGAHILGDKLKCNNSWQTHKNSKYYVLLILNHIFSPKNVMWQNTTLGLIFNGGNCLRCPWSLPWCPFKSPNRNLQIPHRGALCQGKNRVVSLDQELNEREVDMHEWHLDCIELMRQGCSASCQIIWYGTMQTWSNKCFSSKENH